MKEAARLGFEEAISAPLAKERDAVTGMRLNAHTRLESLVAELAAAAASSGQRPRTGRRIAAGFAQAHRTFRA
jgi:hypothetical protein